VAQHLLKILYLLCYAVIGLLLIHFRSQVLWSFGFVYTDSDQNIMWEALKNYANGEFYEPRFYGQNYNSFLEALIGVPLYQAGLPPFIVLPLVTSSLSIFPFFLLSAFAFVRRSHVHALVILSLPLFLPAENALIGTMPRGFVTGIFVASLGCIPAFFETRRIAFAVAGFLAVAAFSVNSNAVLLSLPCLVYLFLTNLRNASFYTYTAAGTFIGGAFHLLVQSFYLQHPQYNLHKLTLEFSAGAIQKGLHMCDLFFSFNTPFVHNGGCFVLWLFVLLAFYFLWKKQYARFGAMLAVPAVVILTFGLNKVYDATHSLFFNYARMYLALPVALAFGLSLLRLAYAPFLLLAGLVLPWQQNIHLCESLEATIRERVKPIQNQEIVIVTKNKAILKDCNYLSEICRKNKVELFVIVNHFYAEAYSYGCASCFINFPKTLNPVYERRTWRLIEDEKRVYNTVLFIDMYNKLGEGHPRVRKIEGTVDLYVAENNTLKTMQLLDSLNIPYRKFHE